MRLLLVTCCLFTGIVYILQACKTNPYRTGESLYKTYCANCHMENGEGLSALIPSLAKSDYMATNRDRLPCVIRYGLQDTIQVNGQTYAEKMPPMPSLSDIQITNVLNFINNSWGNQNAAYSFDEVQGLLEKCKTPWE